MLLANLPVVDINSPKRQQFCFGHEDQATGDSELYDSPGEVHVAVFVCYTSCT